MRGEDGHHRVLDHAVDDAGLDHAHHRQLRRDGAEIELVDAGAGADQQFQVRQGREQRRGRLPGDEVADHLGRADVGPEAQRQFRSLARRRPARQIAPRTGSARYSTPALRGVIRRPATPVRRGGPPGRPPAARRASSRHAIDDRAGRGLRARPRARWPRQGCRGGRAPDPRDRWPIEGCRVASAIAERFVGRDHGPTVVPRPAGRCSANPARRPARMARCAGRPVAEHRVEQRRARRAEARRCRAPCTAARSDVGSGAATRHACTSAARVAAQPACRRCTHFALALQDAAGRRRSRSPRRAAGRRRWRRGRRGARRLAASIGLQQLPADAAALAVGAHDDQAERGAAAAVVPPQRGADQRAVGVAGAEALAQREMQLPVVHPVRPVQRLRQRQRRRQVRGRQAAATAAAAPESGGTHRGGALRNTSPSASVVRRL